MDLHEKLFEFQKNKVLIVCDFYESVRIPESFLKKKHNLTLFPIANIPLIEYILESLYRNKMTDIIISGNKNITTVIDHVKHSKYSKLMTIRSLNLQTASFGDILRELARSGIEFKNILVLFANSFTNLDLNLIITKHDNFRKADKNVIATICLFQSKRKSKFPVYGIHENQLVFFEKVRKDVHINLQKIMKKYKNLDLKVSYSIPEYIVLSRDGLEFFCENFDINNMTNFLKGIIRSNIYGHKIMVYIPEEENNIPSSQEKEPLENQVSEDNNKNLGNFPTNGEYFFNHTFRFYKRTLSDLKNYFEMNQEFKSQNIYSYTYEGNEFCTTKRKKYPNTNNFFETSEKLSNIYNSVIGINTNIQDVMIKSSVISNGCEVNADIENVVIWDGVRVNKRLKDCIVISNDIEDIFEITSCLLESSDESENMNQYHESVAEESFFGFIVEYLNTVIRNFDKINHREIRQQINLLAIRFNSTYSEVVEGIGMFLAQAIELENLSQSIIKASVVFPLLDKIIDEPLLQDYFLKVINEHLKKFPYPSRKDILYRYCFLLSEDGYIGKSIAKKYLKLIKKNLL